MYTCNGLSQICQYINLTLDSFKIIIGLLYIRSFFKSLLKPYKDFNCQAQPKTKSNHRWTVLVLNPTSPTGRLPGQPKKYEDGSFEPDLKNEIY